MSAVELDTLFSKAVEWGLIKRNPVSTVSRPKVDKNAKRLYPTKDEMSRLDDALNDWEYISQFGSKDEQRKYAKYLPCIVRVAVNTGMRKGEVMSLRWSDIDEQERIITVRDTVAKSSTTQRIPISENLMKHLMHWNAISGREHR